MHFSASLLRGFSSLLIGVGTAITVSLTLLIFSPGFCPHGEFGFTCWAVALSGPIGLICAHRQFHESLWGPLTAVVGGGIGSAVAIYGLVSMDVKGARVFPELAIAAFFITCLLILASAALMLLGAFLSLVAARMTPRTPDYDYDGNLE